MGLVGQSVLFTDGQPQRQYRSGTEREKVGVTGSLGATNHVSLLIAVEKLNLSPKAFNILALPPAEMVRFLKTGFIDAVSLNPTLFTAQKKGFANILDIGSLVDMPGGGLSIFSRSINSKPDEVKRVIRAMQSAKESIRRSKDKAVDLMMRILTMDREGATSTRSISQNPEPGRRVQPDGIQNLIKSIQAEGRFVEKTTFNDIADDRLAREVARGWGY